MIGAIYLLSILLLILKIIGIMLLVLIGLVLFLICLILFVPVRYRATAGKETDDPSINGMARAAWLLGIVSAVYEYNDEKRGLTVRIFGIRLKSRTEKERLRSRFAGRHKRKKGGHDRKEDQPDYAILEYDESSDDLKKVDSLKDPPSYEYKNDDESTKDDKPKVSLDERIDSLHKKINKIGEKISNIIAKGCEALNSIDYYHNALSNDAKNREAIRFIYKKTVRLLKSIKPRKVAGHLDYGSDDPADTGRVLAAASVLYPIYGRSIIINPDFENKLLGFDIKLKGRIYINVLAAVLLQLYFNRKVRRFIHIMKKENDNGK